jgi:hypothetical protein
MQVVFKIAVGQEKMGSIVVKLHGTHDNAEKQ